MSKTRTIKVPLSESDLEDLLYHGVEFDWEFPTIEDKDLSIKVKVVNQDWHEED